jgi:hypothetical protein
MELALSRHDDRWLIATDCKTIIVCNRLPEPGDIPAIEAVVRPWQLVSTGHASASATTLCSLLTPALPRATGGDSGCVPALTRALAMAKTGKALPWSRVKRDLATVVIHNAGSTRTSSNWATWTSAAARTGSSSGPTTTGDLTPSTDSTAIPGDEKAPFPAPAVGCRTAMIQISERTRRERTRCGNERVRDLRRGCMRSAGWPPVTATVIRRLGSRRNASTGIIASSGRPLAGGCPST